MLYIIETWNRLNPDLAYLPIKEYAVNNTTDLVNVPTNLVGVSEISWYI